MIGCYSAATPALPLDEAGKYVAGAYIVFLVLIVIYVAIMAAQTAADGEGAARARRLRRAPRRTATADESEREEVSADV